MASFTHGGDGNHEGVESHPAPALSAISKGAWSRTKKFGMAGLRSGEAYRPG